MKAKTNKKPQKKDAYKTTNTPTCKLCVYSSDHTLQTAICGQKLTIVHLTDHLCEKGQKRSKKPSKI